MDEGSRGCHHHCHCRYLSGGMEADGGRLIVMILYKNDLYE